MRWDGWRPDTTGVASDLATWTAGAATVVGLALIRRQYSWG